MFSRVHDVEQMFGAFNRFRHGRNGLFPGDQSRKGNRPRQESEIKLLTNVYDNGDTLIMQVEVAGVAKEDLTIELQGRDLLIKGERRNNGPEGYITHRQDIVASSFARAYTLPLDIAGDKVTSSLHNGILTLRLPKAEEIKKREITIQ